MQTRMPYRQKYQQRPETQQWRKKRQQQEVLVKPWWAIEEDGQPAMMLCGVHMRPKSYSALKHPVGDPKRYLWASAEDKRYRRALGAGEKRGSCLCDYTYYSKLLGEREMADQTIKPSFLLMRLPAELRDEVYRQMLVSPGGVEICPTPYVRAPTSKCRNRGENCESYFKSTVQAEEYQRNSKWETIGQFAGIMRANKQVHKNASRICYSENEFRFTNTTGWMGLDTFLYQIDLRNCSMLRSITVRHADLLNLPCTCSSGSTFWDGMLIRAHLGDRFNRVRWFDADDFDLKGLLSDAASCLQLSGKLQHLRIIVDKYGEGDLMCAVNESKFDKLTVTWTSLELSEPEGEFPPYFCHPEERNVAAYVGEKCRAQKIVEAAGKSKWKWQWLEADEHGCYAGIQSKRVAEQANQELVEDTAEPPEV